MKDLKLLYIKKFFGVLRKRLSNSIGQKERQAINTRGFTLIEVVVSLSLFVFIIGGIIGFSVDSIKASQKSQALQEAVDNARYAIDDLAKKLRTSHQIQTSSDNQAIFFIDNRTLIKYCYKFNGEVLQVAKIVPVIDPTNGTISNGFIYDSIGKCQDFSSGYFHPIVGESGDKISVSGKFRATLTEISADNPHRGYVQINIDLFYNVDINKPVEEQAQVHIQSGVSLMDYGVEDR